MNHNTTPVETYSVKEYTVGQLAELGIEHLPDEMISGRHLIYSSPATLDFNSPGAQSFGVKRAGLSIPGSVMLLLSPGCCGRNTTLIAEMPAYRNRFFYLLMDDTDIITGRHLKKVPDAVEALCKHLKQPPSVVMICITCVDALLGTDMERVCRNAERRVGLPVRPCYMYALTREGRKPPMVHVRQSLYSLLEPRKKKSTSVNLLGYFAPLSDDSELYSLLRQAGVKKIRELSRCSDYDEYQEMAEANFNLVLNSEARAAAKDFERRLKIPSIELRRLYQIDRIAGQYRALGQVLGVHFEDAEWKAEAEAAISQFRDLAGAAVFSLGECMNADPFELSLALLQYGFRVEEIYGTVTAENMVFVRHLAETAPEIHVYSNLEPGMIHHCLAARQEETGIDLTLGKDAAYYRPSVPNLPWNAERQPFGYRGVTALFEALTALWKEKNPNHKMAESYAEAGDTRTCEESEADIQQRKMSGLEIVMETQDDEIRVKGFRRHLAPFAPDQSGAVSVFYELGGLQVICDAGGCTGNICGFDEPRWKNGISAIFSAGLRDMDAVMGRDDQLVAKVVDAAGKMPASFIALIGTPVPAVIGTDYKGLGRMLEKRLPIPALSVDTDGTALCDKGAEKAYLQLFQRMTGEKDSVEPGRLGVIGASPLEISAAAMTEEMKICLGQGKYERIDSYGLGAGMDAIRSAGNAEENLVISHSGLAAAKYLKERFGTPYRVENPLAELLLEKIFAEGNISAEEIRGRRILILQEQVMANSLRRKLEQLGAGEVRVISWFGMEKSLAKPLDRQLNEEGELAEEIAAFSPELIFGDGLCRELFPEGTFADSFEASRNVSYDETGSDSEEKGFSVGTDQAFLNISDREKSRQRKEDAEMPEIGNCGSETAAVSSEKYTEKTVWIDLPQFAVSGHLEERWSR